MNEQTPQEPESAAPAGEERACEYDACGRPVPASLGTKPRRYCRRSCRQRAYEARRQREAIVAAVASAVARQGTSRDDQQRSGATSRVDGGTSRDESPEKAGTSRDDAPEYSLTMWGFPVPVDLHDRK